MQLLPTVYKCSDCKTIVADSTQLVGHLEDLQMHCFAGSTADVEVQKKEKTEKKGPLKNSVYLDAVCRGCKTALGRVYLTSTPKFARLCNCFSFEDQRLESYAIGSGRQRATSEAIEEEEAAGPLTLPGEERVVELEARLAKLEAEMLQVQHQILIHTEEFLDMGRMQALDQAVLTEGILGADALPQHGAVLDHLQQQRDTGEAGDPSLGAAGGAPPPVPGGKKRKATELV